METEKTSSTNFTVLPGAGLPVEILTVSFPKVPSVLIQFWSFIEKYLFFSHC